MDLALSLIRFGLFRAIFRSAPSPTRNSQRILDSPNTMGFHTRRIFHSTSPDQHHRMFLWIMTFARNDCKDIVPIAQPYFCYLTWGWIRFFWCSRRNARAYSSLLRTLIRSSGTVCAPFLLPTMTNQLIECRHRSSLPVLSPVAPSFIAHQSLVTPDLKHPSSIHG
jgi:hypothetical protein